MIGILLSKINKYDKFFLNNNIINKNLFIYLFNNYP